MKQFLLTAFISALIFAAQAQTSLKFCGEVKEGSCANPSNQFVVDSDGGTVAFLIKNAAGLGAEKITYKIYKLDDDGKENYISSTEQKTAKDWTYGWSDVVFFDEGTYKIVAYNTTPDTETLLASGIIKIFRQ